MLPINCDQLPLKGSILYIEDDPISLRLVETLFATRHPGIVLTTATTGELGVQLAKAKRPDLVLLDMHLPDISGLQVMRELDCEIGSGLLVAILTADRATPEIIKAMSFGAFEYWTKPLQFEAFEAGLRRALERHPPDPTCRPRSPGGLSRRTDLSDYF